MNLLLSTAIDFVRSRIDELPFDSGDMLSAVLDDRNLDLTIEKHLPEAVRSVHIASDADVVEGRSITADSPDSGVTVDGGVIDIDFRNSGIKMLRLVSFRCGDSKFVLTNAYPEDSPEGRMQQNRYLRGRPDQPALVRMADSEQYHPHYRYYTTRLGAEEIAFEFRYFPVPELAGSGSAAYCFISENLYYQVLNTLTGMVLMAYKESNAAEYFFKRAQI